MYFGSWTAASGGLQLEAADSCSRTIQYQVQGHSGLEKVKLKMQMVKICQQG